MKQILTVFAFTFKDAVRKKAFIISTIIILLLISIACAIPQAMSLLNSSDNSQPVINENIATNTCYYIDSDNLIPTGVKALTTNVANTVFLQGNAENIDNYKDKVKNDNSVSVIQVTKGDDAPCLNVFTTDFMSGINPDTVTNVLSKAYVTNQMLNDGVSKDTIELSQSTLACTSSIVGNMDISSYVVGFMLLAVMFFAIYYYGYGVSMSIATEKTSRVMETLVVSAKPSRILVGKCLAMGAVGLLQFVVILGYAAMCYTTMVPGDFTVMGTPINLSAFTLPVIALIILYFLLGYALYAVMNAVCGAMVSKAEDVNSAIMPVTIIAMVSFYFGCFSAIAGGEDTASKVAMFLPFSSPFIIPFKLLNSNVATSDIIISLTLLVVSIIIITAISVRIYSASVLRYGKKIKIKDLLKNNTTGKV